MCADQLGNGDEDEMKMMSIIFPPKYDDDDDEMKIMSEISPTGCLPHVYSGFLQGGFG